MQRIFLLTLAAVLSLAACSKESDQAVTDVSGSPAADQPGWFNNVPADTPYLFANLEPIPLEIVDHFLVRSQPLLDKAQLQLTELMERHAAQPGEQTALARALLTEFDGKLSRTGMESLGLSLQPQMLVYGFGPFPVIRLEIHDQAALNATIDRVMSNAGLTIAPLTLNGDQYWQVTSEAMTVTVAVLSDHLVFSILPASLAAERLPQILNQQQAAEPLDVATAIAGLNVENGYTPHGSGYLDVARFSDYLLNGDSPEGQAIQQLMNSNNNPLSDQCRTEIAGLTSVVERLETGYSEISKERMGFGVTVDLEDELAGHLAALTVAGIGFDRDPGGVAAFAFGVDLMKTRDWLTQVAATRIAAPYQCAQLEGMNQQFANLQNQANQPIPPFVGNFMGFKGRLDSLDMNAGSPENIKGVFALVTSNPEMLLGMAQMFLPSMAELDVTKNGKPVALPLDGLPIPATVESPHISMADNALGLSLGLGSETGLNAFLENNGSQNGSVFALGYDFSFYLENLGKKISVNAVYGDEDAEELQDTIAFYSDLVDRQYSEIRFTNQGIEFSQTTSFK